MSFDTERLYRLLPAIYRIRDIEQGDPTQGGPLKALLAVIAEEIAGIEENLAQLYEDQFIETCAEWVVPYIGDLLEVRGLLTTQSGTSSQRAFVAHTLAYRRRKGTALGLEQLARDLTGWDAHVVEYFQLLEMTQSMKHVRPSALETPDLRQWEALERLGSPFESTAHSLDVRSIASRRGRYNIPNIGIFLWRLQAYPLIKAPAFGVDAARYLFSPLGNNTPLYTHPITEGEFLQLSAPVDVPLPISRRILSQYLDSYYGTQERSILVTLDGDDLPTQRIAVCDLEDVLDAQGNVTGWAHMPPSGGSITIDPILGRLALPPDTAAQDVRVSWYYGFSFDMGGGAYDRLATFDPELAVQQQVPTTQSTIQNALNAMSGDGVIAIEDNGRYMETPAIHVTGNQRLELRAANGFRPLLQLGGDLVIDGAGGAQVTLNGLLISGGSIHLQSGVSLLRLVHCTLVPGGTLDRSGKAQQPAQPALMVDAPAGQALTIEIDHCITGPLRVPTNEITLTILDSIVDAPALLSGGPRGVALAADDLGSIAGPETTIERSTVMGTVAVRSLTLASNVIFAGQVTSQRRQEGCVRFSFVPNGSVTPRRYRCQPDLAVQQALDAALHDDPGLSAAQQQALATPIINRIQPDFVQQNYGQSAYGQLTQSTAIEIRIGADDGAEMGAFHDLYQPQRTANLSAHLEEYLRFGLEAGIFFAS